MKNIVVLVSGGGTNNMGVGMVWFVPANAADEAVEIGRSKGFTTGIIGEIIPGHRDVRIR